MPPERLLPVGTVTARLAESYPVERSFVGRVEAQRESDVGFELAGLVAKINVDDGASVRAGQVLASLDTELLEARREELVSGRAQARANLDLATKTRKRIKDLQARDFASSQDRDEAIEGVNVTQAALEKASAAIRSIDVRIRKSQLRAPYDALVAARHIDEGQVIAAGVPVLRLYEDAEPAPGELLIHELCQAGSFCCIQTVVLLSESMKDLIFLLFNLLTTPATLPDSMSLCASWQKARPSAEGRAPD